MKKLLGVYHTNSDSEESLMIQEDGKIHIEFGNSKLFKNSTLIHERDKVIRDPLGDDNDVTGEGVFDFRYGPVTAGVGKAGVYHLFTYGERILRVKIDPSYNRREVDKRMEGKSIEESLNLAQNICGNFCVSHSLAFSRAVEEALEIEVSNHVKILRAVALELERMYNHMYVISRLAAAAAQLVLTSHLQGLFEDLLVVNEKFSGSRFLRNFIDISGVKFIPTIDVLKDVSENVQKISTNFSKLFEQSLASRNYIDRLHSTAVLDAKSAQEIGLTGPSLRACNVLEDLRKGEEVYSSLRIVTDEEGDSLSRMEVRAHEIVESAKFIVESVKKLEIEDRNVKEFLPSNDGKGEGLGACESPSGSVVYHVDIEGGKVKKLYVSTPSLFGFAAITHSMCGNIFTDFPFAVESYGVNFADAAR